MIRLAKIISLVFNPLILFSLVPFFVVYRQTRDLFYAFKWEVFSLGFMALAVIILFLGRFRGIFSDLDLSNRKERQKFYPILLLLAVAYLIAAVFFRGVLFPLSIIATGIVLGVLVYESANYFVKASGHVGVVCALVLAIAIVYGLQGFLLTVWIIPLVGWSRLRLKKHTLKEELTGGVLGALVTYATYLLGKYLYTI